ncbi:hypothetical protein [Saccharopolyspora spinosa]|uniref:Uncharacterized protein n=1 Tax=Saccharopolyspora spinosa TaxID=60894 RepID=A0A2N3XSW0_SACSN|nr:hypothetical protein [Saccharopolyspora spinosa]PKW13739.1 hypothetical protein A8926_1294 [Saccharopolyspora spinosa]
MGTENADLAVLLRRTQWLLDDLAFQVGAGRRDADDFEAAATALDEISLLLRETSPTATITERSSE